MMTPRVTALACGAGTPSVLGRFCRARCRTAFWSALRRWGKRAIAAGTLTVTDLRNGATAACTLQGEPVLRGSPPALVPEHPGGNSPLIAPAESADES